MNTELSKRIADHAFIFENKQMPVTISVGIASMHGEMISPNELIKKADEKLYQAKAEGRNCVR